MRILRNGKMWGKKRKILASFIIASIGFTTVYLSIGIFIFLDLGSYNNNLEKYYWWDSEDYVYVGEREFKGFYEEANWTKLEKMAYDFEYVADTFNICNESWNCSTTIVGLQFRRGMTSPFTNYSEYLEQRENFLSNNDSSYRQVVEVNPISKLRDSVIWTGNYLASLAFHYAVACKEGDVSEANNILQKMTKPINGYHLLTHVSGLDGNLARFAIKRTPQNEERFKNFFYETDDEGNIIREKKSNLDEELFQGQGEYEDYWYIDQTSRDQHLGYFLGSGISYKLLTEIECPNGINKNLLNSLIEQIENDASDVINCIIGGNWHIITGEAEEGEGRGHGGASFLPRIPWYSGGEIILSILSLGKLIDEAKYGSYYKDAVNRYLASASHFSSVQTGSYYSNNLAFDSIFLAWFLEENDQIRAFMTERFNKDLYQYVQYHRNSYFNLGNLIMNEWDLNEDILKDERKTYRLDDIVDNLNRFADYRLPVRTWHVPAIENENLLDPKLQTYSKIFREDSNHILKTFYGPLMNEIGDTKPKTKFALGVNEMKPADFAWHKDPFNPDGNFPDNNQALGYVQYSGSGYTLPYWMGRYYGYFPSR